MKSNIHLHNCACVALLLLDDQDASQRCLQCFVGISAGGFSCLFCCFAHCLQLLCNQIKSHRQSRGMLPQIFTSPTLFISPCNLSVAADHGWSIQHSRTGGSSCRRWSTCCRKVLSVRIQSSWRCSRFAKICFVCTI